MNRGFRLDGLLDCLWPDAQKKSTEADIVGISELIAIACFRHFDEARQRLAAFLLIVTAVEG